MKGQLNAGEWFFRAREFLMAGNLLSDVRFYNGNSFGLSPVVCFAFSCECLLKCLLTLRQKNFPRDHNLRDLFRLLPSDDRQVIEQQWNQTTLVNLKSGKPMPFMPEQITSINQALKRSGDAFKEWRYRPNSWFSSWCVFSFPNHVMDLIYTIKPEWVHAPPDLFGDSRKSSR